MECEQVRVGLAAHALGGLEPAEAQAVEDHLAGCPACEAEHARHAGVAELMGTVQAWEVAPDAPVREAGPERSLDALRARPRTERDERS
ncbi:zf-HC2 domain-containing protein [Streptomyces sp. NPDC005393]|uniref:anti-sigma factor family protein n=1 Tax=Streptomyces sp. NPDC005393 TaxID=3157041 RepID=UPI0033B2F1B4